MHSRTIKTRWKTGEHIRLGSKFLCAGSQLEFMAERFWKARMEYRYTSFPPQRGQTGYTGGSGGIREEVCEKPEAISTARVTSCMEMRELACMNP